MLQGPSSSQKSLELVQPRAVVADEASHAQGGKKASSVQGLRACSRCDSSGEGFFPQSRRFCCSVPEYFQSQLSELSHPDMSCCG